MSTSRMKENAAAGLGDELMEMKDIVQTGAGQAAQQGKRVAMAASKAAREAAHGLQETVSHARETIGQTVVNRPIFALACAAVAGAVLVMLLRRHK